MGVPVAAAAHGGLTETVVPGVTGLLVPPGDAAALAGALEQVLLLEPAQRAAMGRAGQARVRALYSTSALQSATLAVYERVLRERG
jgi:glycosyltransferase involved in cell wall biosynthesis